MKRRLFILALLFLSVSELLCQVTFSDYSVLSLPEDLKKNADAVYRLDEGILNVTSRSNYTFSTHQIITLLNKDASHHLHQTFYYNKFRKIESIVFKIYDATGALIKSYQKKDFETRDYTDEITLYTDDKLLTLQAASPGYPCTAEVICEIKATSYIGLPDWVVATPNESVVNSSFIVKLAPALDINYRSVNIELKPVIENSGGNKVYTWATKNIIATKPEENSYASYNLPEIELVPQTFEYDGYKGEFKNWQTYGAWNYQFYEDNKPFSKEDIKMIEGLVANCKTTAEKIKTLYSYLQQSMRYVSIQLGIGGIKPFPVKYVNEKKYGDCKALTNYMRYLLKAVGINSYPALINAGYNKIPADASFPSDPFNHVILCVPLEKDSVWLECTSNNNDYGFLGSFTENKNALLLTEKGGVLVATPKSSFYKNVLTSKTIITINEDGGSQVKSDISCTGDFWDMFYYIMKQDPGQEKNIFINYLHYKIPEQFKIEEKQSIADRKKFDLTLSYDQQYDFKTGSKLFFKPRISMLATEEMQPVSDRRFDYIFNFPYTKSDTTIYILPKGSVVDKLPAKKEMMNEYASYNNEYFRNDDSTMITIIANLTLKKRIVPSADYLKVALFFQDVKRSENEKFIVKQD